MRLRSNDRPWAPFQKKLSRVSNLVPEGHQKYLAYFMYLAEGNTNILRKGSFGSVLASVDSSVDSQNVVWETPDGDFVLSRKALREIADEVVLRQAGREIEPRADGRMTVAEALLSMKTAKKVDYPKDFKEALTFMEKEIKKLQKEMFEGAPIEQVFFQAYENLSEVTPDFCCVWDRFALAKGLKQRGWSIRASGEPVEHEPKEARGPYQDMALDLQSMLGFHLNGNEFTEMSETKRGCISLLYGKQADEMESPKGVEYHLWYAPWGPTPTGSAMDIVVLSNGMEVARFSEDNETLFPDLFQRVVADSKTRWTPRTAAQFPMKDEVDNSLPKALQPDRAGWHQMLHQVYLATRDFLRHEVPFLPSKMFLLGERWNGDTMEYTLRGDRENTAIFVRGGLNLKDPSPMLSLEATYEKDGQGWTRVRQFPLSQYEKTSELVSEVQNHLANELGKGIQRLEDRPSTTDQILQRALTADLLS